VFEFWLVTIAIAWLILAYQVGKNARHHGRSGIIWFCIVAVTGIFGVAIYMLKINGPSQEKVEKRNESEEGQSTDSAILKTIPSILVGGIGGGVIAFIFLFILYEIMGLFMDNAGLPDIVLSAILWTAVPVGAGVAVKRDIPMSSLRKLKQYREDFT
jgi:hypothetical protein